MDGDCPVVRLNIKQVWKVYGRLGGFIRREGADLIVSAMFYRAVTQVVLLFCLETWVILAAMERMVEGNTPGF